MRTLTSIVMLIVAPLMFVLNIVLLPVGMVLYYPLQHWWGHKVIRWVANVFMGAAAYAWLKALWQILVHHQFWWQMVWGPLLSLAVGSWLKSVHATALAVQIGIDVSLDPLAVAPEEQVRAMFYARPNPRAR
jgi:hypothetical protein